MRSVYIAAIGMKEVGRQCGQARIEQHAPGVLHLMIRNSPQKIKPKAFVLQLSLLILMLTDVLLEGSQLLYVGSDDVISQAFGVTPRDNEVFLPKVMSRKKQIIPSLSALWG